MKGLFVAGCGCLVLFIAVPILLSILGSVLGIINLPFYNFGKKVDLNYGIINKTYETDYCLANYEWFKDRYNGILGMDDKIAIQKRELQDFQASAGSRKNWTFEDKQTDADLRNKVTALENIKVTWTNEYNSRTEQLNRVACKELPLFINL
jgi:hypothetical protein